MCKEKLIGIWLEIYAVWKCRVMTMFGSWCCIVTIVFTLCVWLNIIPSIPLPYKNQQNKNVSFCLPIAHSVFVGGGKKNWNCKMLKLPFRGKGCGGRGWQTKLPKHISAFMRMYGKIVCLYLRFYLQYLNGSKYETMKKKKKKGKQTARARSHTCKTNKHMHARQNREQRRRRRQRQRQKERKKCA